MIHSLIPRIANRLRREIVARWPRRVDSDLPAAFGDALRTLGIGPGSQVLLAMDEAALWAALPVPRIGGLSKRRAERGVVETVSSLVGNTGLLVVPYHPVEDPKKLSHDRALFVPEAAQPKGLAGAILDRPGAVCSAAPILALAAVGADAEVLTEGQIEAAPYAMGQGSPWEKMLHRSVRMVMTRSAASVNYGMLLAAHLRHADYDRPTFFHRSFPFRLRARGGHEAGVAFHLHACPFQPRYDLSGYADFGRFMDYLDDKCGLYTKARVGGLELVACDYAAQYQACLSEMDGGNYLEDARYW